MDYIFEYLLNNYSHLKNNSKIVVAEIGIGFYVEISKKMQKSGFNVIAIDSNEKAVIEAFQHGLNSKMDDIFKPDLKIYKNIKLIYSIRPPRDLQPYLLNLSKNINCDLVIKPLSGEEPISELKLVNYFGKPLYIWKK
ncbi:Protein of unknown function UPF0146 [Methanococcus vannielii SB]|uniref:UPF0146 protein Mevan_1435 n=1 Tax=Methanococcus vannielii (strain ATCC 35089 / DSM 1224 / JCM 13029 / OCM 148 / SB) TaxID=406327 RepID=A6US58_METVS|nr:UPF0146 family protein [Methanococcus vannielii]ABR55330.1 Protein of unknown function UPF0146 [Methanococcus vannielii SB]